MKRYPISEQDAKAAKWPHEVFLINLIFNHILLFVAFLSASSLQKMVIVVPVLSFLILGYSVWRARKSRKVDSWYVRCHWQLADRRSKVFIGMLALMGLVILAIFLVAGGHPGPQHYAIGGATVLPTMLTILVLIMMESEALHLARAGHVPDWLVERFPEGALQPLQE